MKVRKIPQFPQSSSSNESIIFVDSASSVDNPPDLRSLIHTIVAKIVGEFPTKIIEELIGIDQIYIDLDVENKLVTINWDSMAGISIECQDDDLTKRIFQYLKSL